MGGNDILVGKISIRLNNEDWMVEKYKVESTLVGG